MSPGVTKDLPAAVLPSRPSLVGERIDGRYLLEEQVEADGLCAVYRARDKTDRFAAVQVLHEGAPARVDFQRAAETLAALAHPNIAGILEYGVWRQRSYVVLEWLEGESLESRLSGRPLALDAGLAIVRQLLAALASVHAAGLVHGALEPGHVFLQRRKHGERVKVQHFRLLMANATPLAAISGASSEPGELSPYRAPEQVFGCADARSDVFALGVMLSEIVAAIVRSAGHSQARVSADKTDSVFDEVQSAGAVDLVMKDLIRRATAAEPDARYSDAAELLCELIDAMPRASRASTSSVPPPLPTAKVSLVDAPHPSELEAARIAKLAASKLAQAPSPLATGTKQRVGKASAAWKSLGVRRLLGAGAAHAGAAQVAGVEPAHLNTGAASLTDPAASAADGLALVGASAVSAASGASPAADGAAARPRNGAAAHASDATGSRLAAAVQPADGAEALSLDECVQPSGLAFEAAVSDSGQLGKPVAASSVASTALDAAGQSALSMLSAGTRGADARNALRAVERSRRRKGAFSALVARAGALRHLVPSRGLINVLHSQLSAALVGAFVAAGALTWLMRTDASTPRPTAPPKPVPSAVQALPALEPASHVESSPPVREPAETSFHAAIAPESAPAPAPAPARPAAAKPPRAPRASRANAPRNPWLEAVPAELQGIPAHVAAGGKGNEPMVRTLHAYIQNQPRDPRGHLLLGSLYYHRLWRADCLSEWTQALRHDPSVRGTPELLGALIKLVIQGKDASPAADLLVIYYGREALDAIEDALPPLHNSDGAARLQAVHTRILANDPD
jgi:hypothetical protein